ncbi:MAG: ABC transporter ATP-binding protein [Clostridiales bacterium]|nr:ABC transporter ATP-binding protein [Clostridiales bacterium]
MNNNTKEELIYRLNDICFSYGDNSVIKKLSCEIKRGKITTLIGANGCGKSTLFSLMTKNLKPDSGSIYLGKSNLNSVRLRELARQVAIVHQNNTAPGDITAEKLVSYGRTPYRSAIFPKNGENDDEKIRWAMDITNTYKFKNKAISQLSGGQRQRVWIAMALAQDTEALFLDEPTTFLDMRYQFQILGLVRRLNKEFGVTVIMVLHDINQSLCYSDEVIAMKDGCIIKQGEPQRIIDRTLLKTVYGVDLNITYINGRPFVLPV